MKILTSFLRKNLFTAHGLGQSRLTLFLLLSTLCFLASSYEIDNTCRNYNGKDIREDIQQVINEVQDMALNAYNKVVQGSPYTINLLQALFGKDPSSYHTVGDYFATLSRLSLADDFVVICGDSTVVLEDDLTGDPRGVWADNIHIWQVPFQYYTPCDAARRPGMDIETVIGGFTVHKRLIYLCPAILDHGKGRTFAPYKDQVLAGQSLDSYLLAPELLFHELLHTRILSSPLFDEQVRDYPPLHLLTNPSLVAMTFSDAYRNTLPMVSAYGFSRCAKLAIDSPDRALQNADNVALCALGLYFHRCDWGRYGQGLQGSCIPIDPGGK